MSIVANRALPQGYKLHNYRIDRAISRERFSRSSIELSTTMGQSWLIKEYLPSGLVLRSEGSRVHASSIENIDSSAWDEVLFRRREITGHHKPSQRRSSAQLLPRQRDCLHGDEV